MLQKQRNFQCQYVMLPLGLACVDTLRDWLESLSEEQENLVLQEIIGVLGDRVVERALLSRGEIDGKNQGDR